ncbi:MAG TPA: tripartite tricarboxylate transporter substrate binding protein [Pseudolabrys sp.]|uniref:Bug family tripartite tricarboxylate transporter substrate binding protein n=1 Tax=Pseudolabrys sp. TaxID=1960880 RepID=UPI002DDD3298|nr:tripartite tricarboxylate transporter substrate binding protein [Pseudolabrys sp.]HEV2629426.1 tripartite tricarboxylate transporter substrate binding protein [Pseudolabrys sp.]
MRRLAACLFLLSAIVISAAAPARAEDYPTRTIKVLTTSSAGGLSDIFMRVLADKLRQRMGQNIIIENRPGGAGNIAMGACAAAKPDGYTICIVDADPLIYNQYLYKNLTYNAETGLTPIVNLFSIIQALIVNTELKVNTVDDLVALSKAKKGTLSYLTASLPLVVYMEHLKKEKGADWVRVPFRGGGEATNAVLSGSTPIALIGIGNVMPHIKAGKMKALALANNIRTPQLPSVPTLADTGYKGPPSRSWYGLFAPAGTPKPVIDRINKEVRAIVGEKEFQEKNLFPRGLVPALDTPEEFAAEIKAGRSTAQQVVKDAGMEQQ